MKRGSMLMETVLVMPILLVLIFGILQFAHIWMARQMTAYAAFCAARACQVVPGDMEKQNAAQRAAEIALSWMNLACSNSDLITVPGWGRIVGSGTSDDGRSRVRTIICVSGEEKEKPYVAARVRFDFPLMIPGMAINKIIAGAVRAVFPMEVENYDFYADLDRRASAANGFDKDGWPYLTLTETCVLPQPYSTVHFPAGAFDDIESIRAVAGNR